MDAVVAMKSGRSKALSSPLSGLACTAATRDLQTDVAFGRQAEVRGQLASGGLTLHSCLS